MTWKFYHNPQCSKSREALDFLMSSQVNFEVVEYLKEPLSALEMKILINQLESAAVLVRTKEDDFIANPFDVNSIETVALRLADNPRLMERPILQGYGKAAVGRPLENFKILLAYDHKP